MTQKISICVVTYNQSSIITQTLDSIYNQTYSPIELMISDDNSKDSTVQVVKNWVEEHKERFSSCIVIKSPINTGVTANCNRALKKATGEFIKIIADDIMSPDYLEKTVTYLINTPDCSLLFSKMNFLLPRDDFKVSQTFDYESLKLSAEEKFSRFKSTATLFQWPTPTAIYRKEVFQKYGFFDESINMWEDGPFYLNLIKNLEGINLLEENLVTYRIVEKSLSNGIPVSIQKCSALFYNKYLYHYDLKIKGIKAIIKKIRNHIFLKFPKVFFLSPNYKDIKQGKQK